MKSKKYVMIILVILLLLGVGGFMFWKFRKAEETSANNSVAQEEEMSEDTVQYKGEKYRYNSDIKAVLFMGVDKSEPVSVDNHAGQGGQSDTLLLAVLDQEKKTAQLLEISRDTLRSTMRRESILLRRKHRLPYNMHMERMRREAVR